MKTELKTGYFAHPLFPAQDFLVHAIVKDTGLPLCGEQPQEGYEYQWCSDLLYWTYIDCAACQAAVRREALAEGRFQLNLF